ncbi:MAG: sulfonate transport system substrate-binding protein [Chloroflexota bacterium]|jgi:NitT/TauT family transport system substrate-binding protein|nr:sulfonate transport system substrate-binding protein [Chloroflexota bacterium]
MTPIHRPSIAANRVTSPLAGLGSVLAALSLVLAACSGPANGTGPAASSSPGTTFATEPSGVAASPAASLATPGPQGSLKLGYFPNITHATAIVGVESGIFARDLGPGVTFETATFNAGSSAIEALLNGAVDATYIGPNPAINGYAKSGGAALRIIAGATSGGAFLVVKPSIKTVDQLKGTKLATPQLGNTQDVALRTWLLDHGLKTDAQGGGDVSILPQDNAQTLETFSSGGIDGAWVPEPWATRLVQEGGGTVLVDERTLWPGGQYVTTQLIVRTDYLAAHADIVSALLAGDLEANALVNDDPARARQLTNQGIEKITGKQLNTAVIEAAWPNLTFTPDPIASSLKTSADHAVAVGLLQPVDLSGIYDLGPLNALLKAAGQREVSGL